MVSAGTCTHKLPRGLLRADPGVQREAALRVRSCPRSRARAPRAAGKRGTVSTHAEPRRARHSHVNTSRGASRQVSNLKTTTHLILLRGWESPQEQQANWTHFDSERLSLTSMALRKQAGAPGGGVAASSASSGFISWTIMSVVTVPSERFPTR